MIILNRWYKINSRAEAERFINYVIKNFNIDIPNKTKYFGVQMLKLVKTKPEDAVTEPYWISFRSKFSENELNDNPALSVESIFKSTHTISNDDKILYKGDIKMTEQIRDLVAKVYEQKEKVLEEKYSKVKTDLIEKSYIGKAAIDFANVFNSIAIKNKGESARKNYKDFLFGTVFVDALTKEELTALKANEQRYTADKTLLREEFQELMALLSITETYEQQVKLLKKYGVIK